MSPDFCSVLFCEPWLDSTHLHITVFPWCLAASTLNTSTGTSFDLTLDSYCTNLNTWMCYKTVVKKKKERARTLFEALSHIKVFKLLQIMTTTATVCDGEIRCSKISSRLFQSHI